MKRTFLTLSLVSCFAVSSAAGELVPAENGGIEGRYIVELKEGHAAALPEVAQELARLHRGVLIENAGFLGRSFLLEIPASRARRLAGDERVVAVRQDRWFRLELAAPRDCQLDQSATLPSPWPANPQPISCAIPTSDDTCVDNWGLDRIDAAAGGPRLDASYVRPATGRGVHVFLLDTGINRFHEEFLDSLGRSRIGSGINFASDRPSGDFSDCVTNSHGTHVAAIAAGRRYGVAKEAILHPVRINQCSLFTSSSIVRQGLRWVIDEVARIRQAEGRQVTAVLNVSANWTTSQGVFDSWFRDVLDAGIVIVNSAGNENALAGTLIPTRIPEVIVAAASNVLDQRWGIPSSSPPCARPTSCGSNYGSAVDLFAPGESVLSAARHGQRSVCANTGTSMAAPHVTGAVALYLERNPTATVQQVTAAILGHASEGALAGDLGPGTPNRLLSSGVTGPVAKPAASCGADRTCSFSAADCAFGGCTYSWDFGDGTVGSGRTTSHVYPRTGSFSAELTVTGGGSSRSAATTASPALFADVPPTHPMVHQIETLATAGITRGCGGGNFCPDSGVTRGQMAVFLISSKDGAGKTPEACTTPIFLDVPCSHPFAAWINELARRGITSGCGGGSYCPDQAVPREQMAVLLLRTLEPGFSPPGCTTAPFRDVPCESFYAPWIAEIARRGITRGCGDGLFCPAQTVTRAQMAVFLVTTFGL